MKRLARSRMVAPPFVIVANRRTLFSNWLRPLGARWTQEDREGTVTETGRDASQLGYSLIIDADENYNVAWKLPV